MCMQGEEIVVEEIAGANPGRFQNLGMASNLCTEGAKEQIRRRRGREVHVIETVYTRQICTQPVRTSFLPTRGS